MTNIIPTNIDDNGVLTISIQHENDAFAPPVDDLDKTYYMKFRCTITNPGDYISTGTSLSALIQDHVSYSV
jgi:hypothetical protein